MYQGRLAMNGPMLRRHVRGSREPLVHLINDVENEKYSIYLSIRPQILRRGEGRNILKLTTSPLHLPTTLILFFLFPLLCFFYRLEQRKAYTMCVVFTYYFAGCGCADEDVWVNCGRDCKGSDITWERGDPDREGNCFECTYPTPDSMYGDREGVGFDYFSYVCKCERDRGRGFSSIDPSAILSFRNASSHDGREVVHDSIHSNDIMPRSNSPNHAPRRT
jgi:hypothetical protein